MHHWFRWLGSPSLSERAPVWSGLVRQSSFATASGVNCRFAHHALYPMLDVRAALYGVLGLDLTAIHGFIGSLASAARI
jgi:hypothetical protein